MRWFGFFFLGLTIFLPACQSRSDFTNSIPTGTKFEVEHPTAIPPTITSKNTPPATTATAEVSHESRLKQLYATVKKDLVIKDSQGDQSEQPFGGISDVRSKELPGFENTWILHSVGSRSYDPLQFHFIAVYRLEDGLWIEVASAKLENSDHLQGESIALHEMDPNNIFIEVKSAAGAHGGCYDLFNFNGSELDHLISSCASSPDAGEMDDMDGDDVKEVVLNWSNDYVFCYACRVRIIRYQLWRWDGEKLKEITLSNIEETEGNQAHQLNNEAVRLAKADLWKDAQSTIEKAVEISYGEDPTIHWNAVLINLTANARQEAVASSGFPLLNSIFYGDYEKAMDILRAYRANELFADQSPLISGSSAEGLEDLLLDWIVTFVDKALQVKPELASGYFLKAWAEYLNNPRAPAVMKNLEQAAMLDRDEELFMESYLYLRASEQGE